MCAHPQRFPSLTEPLDWNQPVVDVVHHVITESSLPTMLEFNRMLELDIICPSLDTWAPPVHTVLKKTGD